MLILFRLVVFLTLQDGYMTPYHISLARSLLYSLLAEVRKEAVPLVDAFDVPDEILNSALGRYDGKCAVCQCTWMDGDFWFFYYIIIYYTCMVITQLIFYTQVHDVYHKYFKKLLKPKL